MRQIAFDTETTGLAHSQGHRIIEIGAVEIFSRKLTGQTFHVYINPNRTIDAQAFQVHGISNEFLQDKPTFNDIINDLIQFIDGSELIIHNAAFDVGFLNAELESIKWAKKIEEHCKILDTLVLAREKHPGQRNNLDALCKRYSIDNTERSLHGALLDAQILARLYLAMTSGQVDLFMDEGTNREHLNKTNRSAEKYLNNSPIIYANTEELLRHEEFMKFLEEV